MSRTVGIVAVQGGVAPHEAALAELGLASRRVLRASDVEGLDGLVLPGGESTAQARLLEGDGGRLQAALQAAADAGLPILATCAGLIQAARWGWLDVDIERNGWGRQIASFEAVADDGTPLVCIRAPRIRGVRPPTEVLLTLNGEPMRVRRGAVVGATDHPELTEDRRLHASLFAPGPRRS